MPFWSGFCQRHSVNLRTETRVLFFEETCFFGIIHCIAHFAVYNVRVHCKMVWNYESLPSTVCFMKTVPSATYLLWER